MGARNVAHAFARWAGKVPGTSMQVLVYMAVVSRDSDDWPWFGLGQAALAELAMGRENPDEADMRAVSRAMAPLLAAGAVTVDRAGASRQDGNSTARYRLNLTESSDAARSAWESSYDGKRRMEDARRRRSHTTKNGRDIRRKPSAHTTESDGTYDGNRRTKEKENYKRSEKTKEEGRSSTASHPSRVIEAGGQAKVIQLFPATLRPSAWDPPVEPDEVLSERARTGRAAVDAALAAHRADKEAN